MVAFLISKETEVSKLERIRCEDHRNLGENGYGASRSHDAAEEQVRAAYYNSEYILDSENFTGVAFGTTEERRFRKNRQIP